MCLAFEGVFMEFYVKINNGKSSVYEKDDPFTVKDLLKTNGLEFSNVDVVMDRETVNSDSLCISDSSIIFINDKPKKEQAKEPIKIKISEEDKGYEDEDDKDEEDDEDKEDEWEGRVPECKEKDYQPDVLPEREIDLKFYVPAITPFEIRVKSGKTLRSILVIIRNKFDFYLNPTAYSVNDINDNCYREDDKIYNDTEFIITKNSSGA
jgi:hypothetical protein